MLDINIFTVIQDRQVIPLMSSHLNGGIKNKYSLLSVLQNSTINFAPYIQSPTNS